MRAVLSRFWVIFEQKKKQKKGALALKIMPKPSMYYVSTPGGKSDI
jgi:hypothetical protein